MYRIPGFLSIILLCCSCSVYQYNVLSSNTSGEVDTPFTFENDSIRVSYYFGDGRDNVEITNKSTKPLYVDWSKSSLIVNGEAKSYWSGESNVNLRTTGYGGTITSYHNLTTTGIINNGTPVTFLPPDSKTRNLAIGLPDIWQTMKPSEKFKKFSEENTPLKLRSYLMISQNADLSSPVQMDHHFWLTEIHQFTGEQTISPKQNAWKTSKLSQGGTAVAVVTVFAGLVGVATIFAVHESNTRHQVIGQ